MPRHKLLIVDDDPTIRFAVADYFEGKGFLVHDTDSVVQALELFRSQSPDVTILDYALPDGDALELLAKLKAVDDTASVIFLTGYGTIELAVRAVKEGAEQFLTKPVELDVLQVVIDRLLENRRSRRRDAARSRHSREELDPFRGDSPLIRKLADEAERVVRSDSPVLIRGETGTGKGVLAKWFHENGLRSQEPFVDLNCAGLSREFLETELFGHERGAFTGAATAKPGLLEVADRGTVFLDEIGDIDLQVQPKLLKVLEEKRFRRLGDVRDRTVDIRLVAATHHDLARLAREGRFRSDLFFRINTITLIVPSLRDRKEDIPLLARYFLQKLSPDPDRAVELGPPAERMLQEYPWPGNIRELRNALERACLLARGRVLTPDDFRFELAEVRMDDEGDGEITLEAMERRHIERVLQSVGGRVDEAARKLAVPRSSLYEKLKRYGIQKKI